MKPRLRLTAFFLGLGLVIAFVPETTTLKTKLTASELLDEIQSGSEMIVPDELANWIIQKDPSFQLIDVRSQSEFDQYHLDGAIHIPIKSILDESYIDFLDQDVKMNIFYSNGSTLAQKAWVLTRQLGYDNNYVLQGGLNFWTEVILNPSPPSDLQSDDEIAKYQFRKGAAQFFGGAIQKSNVNSQSKSSSKPKIKRRKKKKAPEGGC